MFPIPPSSDPTIVTITGPSGSGKSTLESLMERRYGWKRAISVTTRVPRPGENTDGYYFVHDRQFDLITENGDWVEYISFNGARYGVTGSEIERLSKSVNGGLPIVLVVEPNGAAMVRDWCARHGRHVYSVFISAPVSLLMSRILARHTSMGGKIPDQKIDSRIVNLVQHELLWQKDAEHYDVRFDLFDSSNEMEVSERLLLGMIRSRDDFMNAPMTFHPMPSFYGADIEVA